MRKTKRMATTQSAVTGWDYKMRHKLDTAVFSQGWLLGQFESMANKTAEKVNEDPTAHLIATTMQEQFNIVSEMLDDLIKENAELKQKLSAVQSALQ